MTESSTLRTTLDVGALLVEMNLPEKRNALDEALQDELLRVFAESLLIGTEDHREGVRAARERRVPSFTGR
jgi:enoyl-CoA hydratase/carnithine racemase